MYYYLFFLFTLSNAYAFLSNLYRSSDIKITDIKDPPLLLTPYIERGEISLARKLSSVPGYGESYSGFITTNKTCGDNIFFWFYLSQNNWLKDPISTWFQGGPGSSSMLGLFLENGPFNLNLDGHLEVNEYSWNRNSSVIYIDNPVGVGFSFTLEKCYVTTQEQVGLGILNMFKQFFQLFPEIKKNPLYLFGQSYAGKYLPAIAYSIHKSNFKHEINLKGFAVGNGKSDPLLQSNYADRLYQLGLIDDNVKNTLKLNQNFVSEAIKKQEYDLADSLKKILHKKITNVTGYSDDGLYHYIYNQGRTGPKYSEYLNKVEVRRAIHVGNVNYTGWKAEVYKTLSNDMSQSVKPWVEELLDHNYRVVYYTGQMDIVVAYSMVLNFIQHLRWKGAGEYKKASRDFWYVGKELAGYTKTVGNFTEIMVRSAGHMVPKDQPKWAFDLYNRVIFSMPFNKNISTWT